MYPFIIQEIMVYSHIQFHFKLSILYFQKWMLKKSGRKYDYKYIFYYRLVRKLKTGLKINPGDSSDPVMNLHVMSS